MQVIVRAATGVVRGIAAAAASLLLLAAQGAAAYTLYVGGFTFPLLPIWYIRCNDGTTFVTERGINFEQANVLAQNVYCVNHGGVADIDDGSMATAVMEVHANPAPSAISIGRDLGGGQVEALTPAQLEALADQMPNGGELVGYEVLSVDIGGTELLPNGDPSLPDLPIYQAWSNEDDVGPPVGGSLIQNLPVPRLATLGLACVLGALGLVRLRRAGLRVPARAAFR